jgi:1-aminocyclopropane-1-carboxylate deaminase
VDTITTILKPPHLQSIDNECLSAAKLRVSVLRLDGIHPVLSGNKWLKLAPWLALARQQQSPGLVATGGAHSNFLHAAAFACHRLGLPFVALVKAPPKSTNSTLNDLRHWGARLILDAGLNDARAAAHIQQQGLQHYLSIPLGGDAPAGAAGVAEAFNSYRLPPFTHVFCPLGTGTTCMGIAQSGLIFNELCGINPGLPVRYFARLQQQMAAMHPHRSFCIMGQSALERFGKIPTWLPEKMNHWATQLQLPTDVVYTAKAWWLLEHQCRQGYFSEGSRVLFVHTGGLQGNRSLGLGTLTY